MTGLVALSVVLNLMLLHVYSNPFRGALAIVPSAFSIDLDWFSQQPEEIVKLRGSAEKEKN
jgi:hypothetical protein